MPDLKSALINIQQQIRSSIEDQQRSIETQKNIERQIQYLIDGIDLSPDRSVDSIEAQMKSLKDELYKEIGSVRNEIHEIKKDRGSHEPVSLPKTSSPPNQQGSFANKSADRKQQVVTNYWQKLSDDYNQFGGSFGSSYPITEVDETKDSIETGRAKSDAPIILSRSAPGKFWLVEINGYSCLMPNPKQQFNKHNSEVLESLFFFQEPYYAGYKRIFLISPAIACPNRSGETITWQLQEKGNISFTL